MKADLKLANLDALYAQARAEAGAEEKLGKMTERLRLAQEDLIRQVERAVTGSEFIQWHYEHPLNRLCREFLDPVGVSYWLYLSFSYGAVDLSLDVSVDRQSDVVPILRLLAAEGLSITQRPEAGGTSPSKVWKLAPRGFPPAKVAVSLRLTVSAKACKQVQVGTKEVPVFETRCDWGEATEQALLPDGEAS